MIDVSRKYRAPAEQPESLYSKIRNPRFVVEEKYIYISHMVSSCPLLSSFFHPLGHIFPRLHPRDQLFIPFSHHIHLLFNYLHSKFDCSCCLQSYPASILLHLSRRIPCLPTQTMSFSTYEPALPANTAPTK